MIFSGFPFIDSTSAIVCPREIVTGPAAGFASVSALWLITSCSPLSASCAAWLSSVAISASGLTSAAGLKLPSTVGYLDLSGLTSADKKILRKKYPKLNI